MSQLDHVLDDALAGFDEDEHHEAPGSEATASMPGARLGRTQLAAPTAPAPSHSSAAQGTAHAHSISTDAASSSRQAPLNTAAPTAAASSSAPSSSTSSSKPFDPLKRRPKTKTAGSEAAAGLGGSSLSSSQASKASSSSSARRPALTPEVHKLQEDLAQLMNDWSAAMHPEAEQTEQQPAGQQQQQRGVSAVLAALAEQTQRTVEEQSRLRPPPAGAAAAAGGGSSSSGGGGDSHMNMIVDVVMQHLLSKDVLYQPMKEIMDKYPPWLEKHTAAGSNSQLSADDLARYQQQYVCITRLCEAYETEPDNTAKIMQLLQEMQACGEPPSDIVDEMSAAIAADLPTDQSAAAHGDLGGLDLEGLGDLPQELKNCPVQ